MNIPNTTKKLIKGKIADANLPLHQIMQKSPKTAYNKLKEPENITLSELERICDKLRIGIVIYDKDLENVRIERKVR